MTKAEAKAMLKRIQEPEAWEPQINQAAFEALDMAIEALDCSESPNSSDTISRQAAIDALAKFVPYAICDESTESYTNGLTDAYNLICQLPSAHPEQLTDKEQRIFLAAMGREEEVCKQVDEECKDCREPYEDSLVGVCREIIRKVKAALWET